AQEVKILALHGILHLAGFDHERDNGRMARKEAELRQRLNLPASLIERATTERVVISRAMTDRASSPQRKPANRNVVRKRASSVRRTA
ncbi:MAG TPA: rRNA maturation RNAse YbeY, partial [Candidatus Acidoferrum sp.]|nr:rRNA maturation RNAse YbeY [Candidatus Acidoferrum sp.]